MPPVTHGLPTSQDTCAPLSRTPMKLVAPTSSPTISKASRDPCPLFPIQAPPTQLFVNCYRTRPANASTELAVDYTP